MHAACPINYVTAFALSNNIHDSAFHSCSGDIVILRANFAGEADDAPINATAGSKPILTNLQTGPGVDFGAVKIDAVEDPARLRQKLAAAGQRPIPAS